MTAFQHTGKHFVERGLLDALRHARSRLASAQRRTPTRQRTPALIRLERFLDCVLDKHDGRYDYHTYLALDLLPLPAPQDSQTADATCDRLLVHLIGDALRFELRTLAGQDVRLPSLRPDDAIVGKRLRHGLKALTPALPRIGLSTMDFTNAPPAPPPTPVEAEAARVSALIHAESTATERLTLRLSMMPVCTFHDEYLFIRVLQAWEVTFARLVVRLTEAVEALRCGAIAEAAGQLDAATAALHAAAPLFPLLATMQVAAFQEFRQHTDGASAIQSANYKLFETLCRRPDPERLNSAAYRFVARVHRSAVAGRPTVDGLYRRLAPGLSVVDRDRLRTAMADLAHAVGQWRQTHYRLAVRMLGERPGTGYTEGTPYLDRARGIAVFTALR